VRVNELVEGRGSLQGWPWAYEKARPKTHKLKEKGGLHTKLAAVFFFKNAHVASNTVFMWTIQR